MTQVVRRTDWTVDELAVRNPIGAHKIGRIINRARILAQENKFSSGQKINLKLNTTINRVGLKPSQDFLLSTRRRFRITAFPPRQ